MHRDNVDHKPAGSFFQAFVRNHKRIWLKLTIGLAIIAVFILAISLFSNEGSSRTESYKKASGAAGLAAVIEYECRASCKQKYNFNIYIFDNNGQQISVVRPDQHGKVDLAMQEGEYVMLLGKQFGKDKLFPQEKVSLKNGKSLELKLKYKEQ